MEDVSDPRTKGHGPRISPSAPLLHPGKLALKKKHRFLRNNLPRKILTVKQKT